MSTAPQTSIAESASPLCSLPASRGSALRYRTILADPPWHWKPTGSRAGIGRQAISLPYPTMNIEEICKLPIASLCDENAQLWLWSTNGSLHDAFHVMSAWGFRYLAPITFVKPSGCGMWWIHRTQTLLHGYRGKLQMREKYKPTVMSVSNPKRHSEKWNESYELIEAISDAPRLELFARRKRTGWHAWGNEIPCDVVVQND